MKTISLEAAKLLGVVFTFRGSLCRYQFRRNETGCALLWQWHAMKDTSWTLSRMKVDEASWGYLNRSLGPAVLVEDPNENNQS